MAVVVPGAAKSAFETFVRVARKFPLLSETPPACMICHVISLPAFCNIKSDNPADRPMTAQKITSSRHQQIQARRRSTHTGSAPTPHVGREGGPNARPPAHRSSRPQLPEIQTQPGPGATVPTSCIRRAGPATTTSVTNGANHAHGHIWRARDGTASSRKSTPGCNR